jgi:hypothetical protein
MYIYCVQCTYGLFTKVPLSRKLSKSRFPTDVNKSIWFTSACTDELVFKSEFPDSES